MNRYPLPYSQQSCHLLAANIHLIKWILAKFEKGLVFMIVNTLLQSIFSSKNRWCTSVAIAVLAILAGNTTALGDNPNRSIIAPTANGIYLYGESDRPDVVGKEYIIFETFGSKTIGAFYLPRSEFSCFYGQFKGSQLNVTLIDVFDRQKYNFTLGLNSRGLTASKQPMMGEPTYQPLGKISDNDRQILAACKLQLADRR
ncbi:hypothetical protein [Chamaesiphon sp. VAR_48_metabat_135_sub]|uniref:hypothetical protein n=1 Tax=Chamaesiphon sp. VAR_48_metabat_135_sub TaxID=2964699 RepID=UPI00286B90C9|nr:hypothetical protein [Chamaesiphon sp. VAR_48_metabat_135_sub]